MKKPDTQKGSGKWSSETPASKTRPKHPDLGPADDPISHVFPWERVGKGSPPPFAWWDAWEGDPNETRTGGLTPLLLAAWAGNAPLMAILYQKGSNPDDKHQGKGVVELAIESQDMEAIWVALQICNDPEDHSSQGKSMDELPCALGMGPLIRQAVGEEAIRRRAWGLEAALAAGSQDRERGRL